MKKNGKKTKPETCETECCSDTVIWGKNSVIEALESSEREFNKIFISSSVKSDPKIERIKELASKRGIVFQFTAPEKISRLIPPDAACQGVAALISPVKYTDLEDFINNIGGNAVILDGVEDPHNTGAIIRTCVCAGIKGIILPSRRGALINSAVEKTSAGAVNKICIIKTGSLVNAVQKLKENSYWVIASDHNAKDNYYDVDYQSMNFALIMGGEHTGISRPLLKLSDFTVKIPMMSDFNSLNVSNAAAIILFEAIREKEKRSK